MNKRSLIVAFIVLGTVSASAQIKFSLAAQTKASFSKSLGYYEEQKVRHEGLEQWLYGEVQMEQWLVRLGPTIEKHDMGETMYGFCGTPPVPTYRALENRVGFNFAVGYDFMKHPKHDLIATVGFQQAWTTQRYSDNTNDFFILPVFPNEASFYAGSSLNIEYRYTLGNHWQIGAQIGGAYVFGEGEYPRVSPWKMTSSLTIGYRF